MTVPDVPTEWGLRLSASGSIVLMGRNGEGPWEDIAEFTSRLMAQMVADAMNRACRPRV